MCYLRAVKCILNASTEIGAMSFFGRQGTGIPVLLGHFRLQQAQFVYRNEQDGESCYRSFVMSSLTLLLQFAQGYVKALWSLH